MPTQIFLPEYNHHVDDKSSEVIISVSVDPETHFEAGIIDFQDNEKTFSDIPQSSTSLGIYDPARATRYLDVQVPGLEDGTTCTMTITIDGTVKTPPMQGQASGGGVDFHATIHFS